MKAIYRVVEQHSSELNYTADEQDVLPLAEHDVLIEVKACALCNIDNKTLLEIFHKKPQVHFPSSLEVSGTVREIGQDVTLVQRGDQVAGLLRLDSGQAGCSDYCNLSEYEIVRLAEVGVDHVAAAGCLRPGLRAYTALHTLAHLHHGDTVLILSAASPFGIIATQLAQLWGTKVIVAVNNPEEVNLFDRLLRPVDHVIDTSANKNMLLSNVREETGGLGVDVIIDSGVRLFENDEKGGTSRGQSDSRGYLPSKHELISCLAVGGRWVSTQPELQLDPPNCQQLFYRGASVSFLFDQTWTLASSRQGKLLHILRDLLTKVSSGQIGPIQVERLEFSDVCDSPSVLACLHPMKTTVIEMR